MITVSMTATSHLAVLGTVTMAAGIVMARLGMRTGQLKLRRPERRCPACGRLTEGRVCRSCTFG